MKNILVSFALLSFIFNAFAVELELKPHSDVVKGNIQLADVLSSASDISTDILQLDLGASPSLGEEKIINRLIVENSIRQWLNGKTVTWTGAEECIIKRPSRLVSADELVQSIQTELKKQTLNQGKARILSFGEWRPFYVPAGKLDITVSLPDTLTNGDWGVASVRFSKDGQTVIMKTIRFQWSWDRQVWLATRNINQNEPLKIKDFKPVVRNVLETTQPYFIGNLAEADMIMSKGVPLGSILLEQHVRPRTIIQRGMQVLVNYKIKNVAVSMKGTALENGSKGQVIKIMNDTSKKKIYAKVIGEGVLEYVQ